MRYISFNSEEDAINALRIINKSLSLPKKGYHVGGGLHVEMPENWDGLGEAPPGWTKTASEISIKDEEIILQIDHLEIKLEDNLQKLTEEEINKLNILEIKEETKIEEAAPIKEEIIPKDKIGKQ